MNTMIFRDMSYGVYVTTSLDGNRPVGCITNSIMQITSDPATIAVSVNHNNYTNSCIDKSGKFAFSILSENSDPSLIGTFGFQSSKENDKFEGVDYELAAGLPVIKDSCGYVVCRVIDTMETETHTVFLGEVIEAESYGKPDNAMTYAYYHKVVKGKAPKYARCAVMYMRAMNCLLISNALSAARERINLRKWNSIQACTKCLFQPARLTSYKESHILRIASGQGSPDTILYLCLNYA